MAIWALLLGMATLINFTMTGALVALTGNIPDGSLLVVLSHYLSKREEPEGMILYPAAAVSRLERCRWWVLGITVAAALSGAGLTAWALDAGWGTVAMLALTSWVLAANLALYYAALTLWRRRTGRMRDDAFEEAWSKSHGVAPVQDAGKSEGAARGDSTQDRSPQG